MSVTSGGRPTVRATYDDPGPEGGLDAGALADLERLAVSLQRRAAPIRFDRADTAGEREAIFRLRHDIVIERRWAPAAALADGLEQDTDDLGAVFVAGWDGAELVACARLIFPVPGQRMPVERVFDLTVEPAGRVVHIDRLIVTRSHSDRGHRVLAGLLGRCWQEAAARGSQVVAGIDTRPVIRLYRQIGAEVTVLGPGQPYWNEERFPVRIDVGEALPALVARWTELAHIYQDGNGPA